MPKDYVTPNVNDDLQERMQSITQQILSRTRLLHIIDQFNLYVGAPRAAIARPEGGAHAQGHRTSTWCGTSAIRSLRSMCPTSSRSPQIAQQVTSELTNLFINENLEVRQQQSEDTTQFLESQLESCPQDAWPTRKKRSVNSRASMWERCPDSWPATSRFCSGLQSQLQNEEDALNTARQQHVYLQTLADQYRAVQGTSKGAGRHFRPGCRLSTRNWKS